jgi:ArsR family transcriptional regulator
MALGEARLPTAMKDTLESERCARMLRAVADPERLKIIQCLRSGARNVTEIAEALRADIANVSHHLGILRHAGVVLDKKEGRFVVYSLSTDLFCPTPASRPVDYLDLGCCRLELPKSPQ